MTPSTAKRSDPEDPVEKILNRSDPEDPRIGLTPRTPDPEDPPRTTRKKF